VSSSAPRDSCAIIALLLVLFLKLIFGLLLLLREGTLLFDSFFLSFVCLASGEGIIVEGESLGNKDLE
jgi:hypothetical protein